MKLEGIDLVQIKFILLIKKASTKSRGFFKGTNKVKKFLKP